jgi:PhnB protein
MAEPIPDNYPRLTPYLIVDGAAEAINFYTGILGATERGRIPGPQGKVGHAELTLGDSMVMLADEHPDVGAIGPKGVGGTPVTIHVYVEDVDAVHQAALDAGATEQRAPADQFYGDRISQIEDPFGHRWSIATHIEDVSPEEMEKRAAEAMSG